MEEKAQAQAASKTASQNKAAVVKQSSDQASSREHMDSAKAEAKKAKKQRQKAKKQSAQAAAAPQQLPAESSSAHQSSAQAVVPQHQQQSSDMSKQQQPTDGLKQAPSQHLPADDAGIAEHAADVHQLRSSLQASCINAQPGLADASSAHSNQTEKEEVAKMEAAAASSAHRNEKQEEGAKVDACAASKAPAAGIDTTAKSATAAKPANAARSDAAAQARDSAEAKTRGVGQPKAGVVAKVNAAARAWDAADTSIHGGQQADSMPEHAAASSEANQQQHVLKRDQHQQAMTPATELLLANVPHLDTLPPGACAAGALHGDKPKNDLPSTSSEQEHTYWAAAQPSECEHPQTATHATGQALTNFAQKNSPLQAATEPAVGPTLNQHTKQLPSVKGQHQGLLHELEEEERQHIRAASGASSDLSSAQANGQAPAGMAVSGEGAAEAASILTPYRAPAEHCALWFHCPLTKVSNELTGAS